MPPSNPFVSSPSGAIDTEQVVEEARPLAKLVAAVGLLSLVPIALQFVLIEFVAVAPVGGVIFTLLAQFIAAVGTGIVLLYIVARGNQLAASGP